MKKEYTWYPENSDRFNDTYDSIEDAIEDAQDRFDNQCEEYEDEDNSHIINIGEVEHFNIRAAVESIVDDIQDNLECSINDFAYGMDWETEAQILKKDKDTFKEEAINVLLPIVEKYFHFSPEMKSWDIKQYDLKEKKYV